MFDSTQNQESSRKISHISETTQLKSCSQKLCEVAKEVIDQDITVVHPFRDTMRSLQKLGSSYTVNDLEDMEAAVRSVQEKLRESKSPGEVKGFTKTGKKFTLVMYNDATYIILNHPGAQQDGKKRILGKGTQKTAYYGVRFHDGSVVACLVCKGENKEPLDISKKRKCGREAEAHRQISQASTRVVPLLAAYFTEQGKFRMLTPCYDDGTLADLLVNQLHQLDERLVLHYAVQILEAIRDMEKLGILHGDLHAKNVVLKDGDAYLSDFGSADSRDDDTDRISSLDYDQIGDYQKNIWEPLVSYLIGATETAKKAVSQDFRIASLVVGAKLDKLQKYHSKRDLSKGLEECICYMKTRSFT